MYDIKLINITLNISFLLVSLELMKNPVATKCEHYFCRYGYDILIFISKCYFNFKSYLILILCNIWADIYNIYNIIYTFIYIYIF